MSRIYWNDEEDVALDYLPWEAQVLYLRGLKRRMDYGTGLVGATKHSRISRRWLMALLEVHRERGSTLSQSQCSVQKIRSLLSRLQRAGLIEPVKNDERLMIFRMLLADVDQSVSVRNNRGTTEEQPSRNNRPFSNENNDFDGMNNRGTTDEQPSRNNPIPINLDNNYSVAQHGSNSPRARVDRSLVAALAKCGFTHQQVHTPKVMAMLDRWQSMGVTGEHVIALVALIRNRSPGKAFTPAYLEQPMNDYLEEGNEESRTVGSGRVQQRQTASDRASALWRITGEYAARSLDGGDLP